MYLNIYVLRLNQTVPMRDGVKLTPCIPVVGSILEDDQASRAPFCNQLTSAENISEGFDSGLHITHPSLTSSKLVILPFEMVN